jgi:hypothetical protein
MALEEGRRMMFRVVLCLVPGLFYVKYMETNEVPWFHVPFRVRVWGRCGLTISYAVRRSWNT